MLGLGIRAKIFGLGLGLAARSPGLVMAYLYIGPAANFLQRLSVNFLEKTINHFIKVLMPRNNLTYGDRQTSAGSFYLTIIYPSSQ